MGDTFKMEYEITSLCRLLDAKVCAPIEYSHELEKENVGSRLKLVEFENDHNLPNFINCNKKIYFFYLKMQ